MQFSDDINQERKRVMRSRKPHFRPVSKTPGTAQTALDLKLEALLTYYVNGLALLNNTFLEGGAAIVNMAGTLGGILPYKNSTGGSSQGGGTDGGTDGGTGGDGGGIL